MGGAKGSSVLAPRARVSAPKLVRKHDLIDDIPRSPQHLWMLWMSVDVGFWEHPQTSGEKAGEP